MKPRHEYTCSHISGRLLLPCIPGFLRIVSLFCCSEHLSQLLRSQQSCGARRLSVGRASLLAAMWNQRHDNEPRDGLDHFGRLGRYCSPLEKETGSRNPGVYTRNQWSPLLAHIVIIPSPRIANYVPRPCATPLYCISVFQVCPWTRYLVQFNCIVPRHFSGGFPSVGTAARLRLKMRGNRLANRMARISKEMQQA